MSAPRDIRACTFNPYEATIQGGFYADHAKAYVTSLYGPRAPILDPDTGIYTGDFHHGLDSTVWPLQYDGSVPLYALFGGTVTYKAFNDKGFGHMVRIESLDGDYMIDYFHLFAESPLEVRQKIGTGSRGHYTEVGRMGNTGLSTGPHSHITVWYKGMTIDPLTLLIAAPDLGEPRQMIPGSGHFYPDGGYQSEYGTYSPAHY